MAERGLGAHAIVIGSGIAGLCAAQVLCRYFDNVTLLERGAEPHDKQPRKEVPQGYHLHALLKGGEQALEQLFPGIVEAMVQDGSTRINGSQDLKWLHHGVWKKRFEGDIFVHLQSRPFLEKHIRLQVEKNHNLHIQYNMMALKPIFDKKQNMILGVQAREAASSQMTDLYADLIIDASGYGSQFHQWFQMNNYQDPEEKVKIDLCYVSQTFQLSAAQRDWETLLVYPSAPIEKIGGSVCRIEGNRHIFTMFGYDSELAHSEIKETQNFIALTKKLPNTMISDELEGAKPLSEVKIHKVPYIVRHHYEKVRNFPQRFLFIGDAFCRFDPVFGQGMSVAAMEALALDDCLQREWKETKDISPRLTKRFYRSISKVIGPVWKMIIIEDFRYHHVAGKKPLGLSILQWYTGRVFHRSSQNVDVYNAFIHVMNLLRPVSTLFSPSLLYKVLRKSR
ncbi:2-polyprenyl-6-methoxyphenol hydroxylase-like FAD-dependent oxidoreductase [Paenibacillus cellulosilyticus]|uniref:2-polyprenyl-6-methoxyphenol hydroxylase-like FAD-dependent oxidoreductase n=1 Tax=Paenibacillus cellulosilyticus TaxID=375489 RepID=A0A2V2YBU9_9BACL|nr:glutamate synthase subunit beta [Paenibacillus cellulosilyticus]PWV89136.1 2-polyprenyl-6-methoxyphenol hydroxylase-like FAD-dependent oxidoreductase [Paenibacillus cellulosilyticus]QKS47787.1 glutamate synthase subunit beta [Paenibacillus cellulosilyticus]